MAAPDWMWVCPEPGCGTGIDKTASDAIAKHQRWHAAGEYSGLPGIWAHVPGVLVLAGIVIGVVSIVYYIVN